MVLQRIRRISSGIVQDPAVDRSLREHASLSIVSSDTLRMACQYWTSAKSIRYIETLLKVQGRKLEIVNESENDKEDLLADFTAILYSFCARMYGLRRAKRKTAQIVAELEEKGDNDATS